MQYRPDNVDIIEAIQDFLKKEMLPYLKDDEMLSYKALVSWNMLGGIARELRHGRKLLEADCNAFAAILNEKTSIEGMGDKALLELTHRLARTVAQKIRKDKTRQGEIWNIIKSVLQHNLEISNPRYGLATEK